MCLIFFSVAVLELWCINVRASTVGDDVTLLSTFLKDFTEDVIFWTSNRTVQINGVGKEVAVWRLQQEIPIDFEGRPTMNIFLPENETVLWSYLSKVHQLFHTSRNLTEFRDIYSTILQNIFIFVLPQQVHMSAMANFLKSSRMTSFTLNSKCFALERVTNTSMNSASASYLKIHEFYYLKNELRVLAREKQPWENAERIFFEPVSLRRRNFEMARIIALGYCSEEYPYECEWDKETQSFGGGVAVAIFRDLKKALNFSEGALNRDDGYVKPDELNDTMYQQQSNIPTNLTTPTWLLVREQVDIVISVNIYTAKLSMFFTLPHPSFQIGLMAFFQQPLHTQTSIFIYPFRLVVWQIFFYFFIILTSISGCFVIVERFYLNDVPPANIGKALFQITSDVVYATIACFCQRGLAALPLLSKLRYIFTATLFASILWNAAYQAGYVSTMSVQERPIRTFKQLLEAQYGLSIDKSSVSIPYFVGKLLESKNISLSRLGYVNNSNVFEFLSRRQFAYLEYFDTFRGMLGTAKSLRNKNPDDFFCQSISAVAVDQRLLTSGFVLPKHSQFREYFNIKLIQLKELGLNFKYMKIYQINTQPRCLPLENLWSDLELRDVKLAFCTLIYACILSSGLLICENVIDKWNGMQRRSSLNSLKTCDPEY